MYLLFDIGGTNMRIGISSNGNTLKETKIVPTPENFEQGIQTLKQISDELSNKEKITGVAGGIAGVLDQDKTMLISSTHINRWVKKPFKQELKKIFGCRVFLENDAALGGLGEAVKGAGAGKNIVAYLGIGTGIGGVRIVEGKIDKNSLGFEPGHQIVVIDGNQCHCGNKGHLEAYVGGLYIEKIYQQRAENIKDAVIWNQIAKYLAVGLNNVIVHWSPDVVVLGGSVMKSLPLDMTANHLKSILTLFPQPPQLVLATLGHDAGLYGALALIAEH
ncbi:ROK family protein [Patescibacteria group bacterium]|nr:ROK family protein [Patescibacteria group bacterium]